MKRRLSFFHIGVAGMLIIFSSCQKELDVAAQRDELRGTPLPNPTTYCRIESIWENPGMSNQQFFLISYDEFENPKFMTAPSSIAFPGPANMFRTFKYDTWHRLKEYIISSGSDIFEEWHHYSFDLNGRIGMDENYIWANSSTGVPTDYFELEVSFFTYDSQGRISRVEMHRVIHGGGSDTHYNYDAAGNLIRDDVTYDNKVSLLRTNDIWMFIHRDYSMNNPFVADGYNSSGYPTTINVSSPAPMVFLPNPPFFHPPVLNHSQIGYGCRPSFYH